MKILVVCNKPPYPPKDGGAIAILNLSRTLGRLGHNVHILAMNTSKHKVDNSITLPFENLSIEYVDIDTDIKPFKALINLFFSTLPYNAERFISRRFAARLSEIIKNENFDVVQFEGPYMWYCIDVVRNSCNAIVCMRSHNIENEIWFRSALLEKNLLKRLYIKNLARRIKKFEINLYNNFDSILAITSRDKEELQKLCVKRPMLVVPIGIDPPKKNIQHDPSNISLFHIGALDWLPNQEGLIWFINNVLPLINSKFPDIKFHIAGRNAPAWIEKLFNKPGIVYHGEIEDAHSFINNSGIMIVPLFSGSGMRVKIVEGMAFGKPIVTTSIGAEGLEVTDGTDIFIADDEISFSEKIFRLIEESELNKKMSEKAQLNAVEKYNNSNIALNVIEFYKKLVDKK